MSLGFPPNIWEYSFVYTQKANPQDKLHAPTHSAKCLTILQTSLSNNFPGSTPRILKLFDDIGQLTRTALAGFFNYEWAKSTKFLWAVIYGSPRQLSYSSKTFKFFFGKIHTIGKIGNLSYHFRISWII